MSYWTSKDYDYIGAPWTIKEHNSKVLFDAMGNGGLSLRKVSKFIEVLSSKKFYYDDDKFFGMSTRAGVKNLFLVKLLHKLSKNSFGLNYLSIMKFLFRGDEDYFWAFLAKFFVEDFNLGSCTDALMFSFETEPRYCYIENNNKLPFGCHAWEKYDKAFWIDILEQQGYEI